MRNTVFHRPAMFQAFDALKGFRQMLAACEETTVEPYKMTEERIEELNMKVPQIVAGKLLKVIYCKDGKYIEVEGMVTKIDFSSEILQIVKTRSDLKTLVSVEVENFNDTYDH